MDTRVFESSASMSQAIAEEITALLKAKPSAHICLAAGHTSLGTFEALIGLYRQGEADFSQCRFTAMDEWLAMNDTTPGSCGDFLRKSFLSQVNFREENICLFGGLTGDAEAECERVRGVLLSRGPFDFLLLGSGMNGHLALNEPGVSLEASVHVTTLSDTTKTVGKKYFQEDCPPALTGGLTIGIADMATAKRAVLAVTGAKKRDILSRIMTDPISSDCPATAVKGWENASLFCDKEACPAI